eukprot:149522-Rhodomonas_salina.1
MCKVRTALRTCYAMSGTDAYVLRHGVSALAYALSQNHTITRLDLSNNRYSFATGLRAGYAMSDTDLAYAATRIGDEVGYCPMRSRYKAVEALADNLGACSQLGISLLACYAISGTYLAYVPMPLLRNVRYKPAYEPMPLLRDVRCLCPRYATSGTDQRMCPCLCYAMSGTDLAYAASSPPPRPQRGSSAPYGPTRCPVGSPGIGKLVQGLARWYAPAYRCDAAIHGCDAAACGAMLLFLGAMQPFMKCCQVCFDKALHFGDNAAKYGDDDPFFGDNASIYGDAAP